MVQDDRFTTGLHNTSEIGRLRKVMLHRPGRELENLMPEYLERLLFDDIPYLKAAQQEHDAFADCLRRNGAEVVYLRDLVAESITDETVRQELVEQFLDEAELKAEKKKNGGGVKTSVSRNFKTECDVRGMTGEEAWFVVDKYLDEAKVVNMKSVMIIHGKGTGALRNALWKQFKSDSRVSSFRAGQYGEGDYGVTVVELK